MRTALTFLLATALLGIALPGTGQGTASDKAIYGRIIDATTGEPVATVFVTLPGQGVGAVTDDDGAFILAPVPDVPGLRLRVEASCYLSLEVELDDIVSREPRRVDLGLPYRYPDYGGMAPPLGGCEQR